MTKEEKAQRRRELRYEKKRSTLFKENTDKFIEILDKNGYHITEMYRSNGYFIFEMGGNSVNTFWIKELPGWRFGLWWTILEDDDDTKKRKLSVEFFTQFEKDVDKFKPSRSTFSESDNMMLDKSGWKLVEWETGEGKRRSPLEHFFDFGVSKMLKFIKEHPYRAWARSSCWEGDKYRKPWTGLACWWRFNKNLYEHWKRKHFENWANNKLLKFFKEKVLWLFEDAGVYNHECLSPSYEFYAPFSKNKSMFESCGLYGIFLEKDEIEEFSNSSNEKLKTWARVSPKLEKKYKRLSKRLERLANLLDIWYSSDVTDTIAILREKAYKSYTNGELGL